MAVLLGTVAGFLLNHSLVAGIEPMEIVHLRPCPTPALTAMLEMTSQVVTARLFLSQPIEWVIMQEMERSSQRFDPGWKG